MNSPHSDPQEILRARARALAQSDGPGPNAGAMLDLLEFRLAQERYAVENRHIQEVCPFKELTPLPCTPAFIRGIVNVRGRILPVLDLKRFFGLPEIGLTDLHRIILVRSGDLELGLLADDITGLRALPASSVQPAPPTLTGIPADYLKGVTAERLIVLDLAYILADPALIVNEEVET